MDKGTEILVHQRIDRRREFVCAGITWRNVVLTEQYLDEMAERFLRLRIREWTGATFESYLGHPEHYEKCTEALMGARVFDYGPASEFPSCQSC